MKPNATNEYNKAMKKIYELLSQVQDGLVNHEQATNSEPHWGHVGDLNHVIESLTEIRNGLPAPDFEAQEVA